MLETQLPGLQGPTQMQLPLKEGNPDRTEVERAVQGLLNEAMTYSDGPDVLRLLGRLGRFSTLAPYNALLLDAQAPGCRFVLPCPQLG